MCFYNDDCDWTASVHEETVTVSDKDCHCDECGDVIRTGEWVRRIRQQEHEQCARCRDEFADDYEEGHDCQGRHDYGETYDYVRCQSCERVLATIAELEAAAGCPEYARQPRLGELWEEMRESSDGQAYVLAAVARHPELASHQQVKIITGSDT